MRRVKVYVEGATRGKSKNVSANIAFRRGFWKFAKKLGLEHKMPSFIECGGRQQTWDAAWNAFLRREYDEIIVLLVDSEEPTKYLPKDAWKHLKERGADGWSELEEEHSRFVFLMTTTMETWVISDPDALRNIFKDRAKVEAIPKWPDLESVLKNDVLSALEQATSGQYAKGQRSFEVFGKLNPQVVSEKCPHAKHFCDSLRSFCS